MKHNYLLKGCIALAAGVAMLCCSSATSAQNPESLPTLDGADLKLNTTYYCSEAYKNKTITATFTATQDVRVAMEYDDLGTGNWFETLFPFYDEDFEDPVQNPTFENESGSKVKYLEVEKGQTIYFLASWCYSVPFTVRLYDADSVAPELRSIEPRNGTKVSASMYKFVDFWFNDQVSIGGVKISGGSNSMTSDALLIDSNTTARVNIGEVMMQWYKAGTLKAGDKLEITLTDVASAFDPSNKVNGDGVVKASYTVFGKPVSLISTHNTAGSGMPQFLSYYFPDDEKGVVTLTFDGPLMPYDDLMKEFDYEVGDIKNIITPYMLYTGNMDGQDVYYESITPVYDAENYTVTLDLRGKLRTYTTMNLHPTEDNMYWYEIMTLQVNNLRSADGQLIYNDNLGSLGSFGFGYPFVIVENSDLASEYLVFESANSDNEITDHTLQSGNRLEVYIDGYKNIRFSGFAFEYANGAKTVVVPMEEITLREEPGYDNAMNYVFTVPKLPGASYLDEIKVYPEALFCNDGMNHRDLLLDTFKWNVQTGIDSVEAADETVTVYSVDGRVVLRGAKSSDIVGLAKGLYIAGGKKIQVK